MVTQTCTERDGLTHAVFLRRLAGAPSATSADARLGNGAFLALRLVDLLGPGSGPAHADVFRYQQAATERVCRALPADCPETGHLTGLVRAAADAFQDQEVRVVAPALLAYAHFLEDELRLDEALDALETLHRVGAEHLACADAIAVQLRIGRVNRKLNRFIDGDVAYALAGVLAEAAGNVHSAFLSRVGRAISTQARGNLVEAERLFRELAVDARAAQERDIEARAHHALGTTLLLRGQIFDAIVQVWQAFEMYEDESSSVRALNDLGVMLAAVGRVDDAERALTEVVRRGGARDNVSNAMIELMHCASYRRDRVGFERWRSACEARKEKMPPNILADFLLKAGIGQARFGRFRRAEDLMNAALVVAERADSNELAFRIERIRNGLRSCEANYCGASDTAAEPFQHGDSAVGEVAASLARLGG